MRKVVLYFMITVGLLSISGCKGQDTANNKDYSINITKIYDVEQVINYNCIMNSTSMNRFIIPIATDGKCNNIEIKELYGENINTFEWEDIESYEEPFIYKNIYIYHHQISITNITCAVSITSALIIVDGEEKVINFKRFVIDSSIKNPIVDLNLSKFNIPVVFSQIGGKFSSSISFTAGSAFSIDKLYFNDFIEILTVKINDNIVDPMNINLFVSKGEDITISYDAKLTKSEYETQILYFNFLMDYRMPNSNEIFEGPFIVSYIENNQIYEDFINSAEIDQRYQCGLIWFVDPGYDINDVTVLEEYTITYNDTTTDVKSQISTETTTTRYGGTVRVTTKSYTYDNLGRLTQESQSVMVNGGTPTVTTTNYTYDAVGNRLSMTQGANELYYHYNDYDQLLCTGKRL